ncbi:MAG TPA: Na+/H+ antiporter [Thermoleophilaceae bacterium]|nr:Na+/H+ antiporter [Thermoleophilaceae bacterium]
MLDAGVIILLLTATTVLAGIAARTGVPYPIVLVLGGLVLGIAPGPTTNLDPDLVLVLFLPPLVYAPAFYASIDEVRAGARPILELATGLVLITGLAVALVAHHVVGLPWEVAAVLGAILGPTDPIAATSIVRRIGAPERLVTILEGESLVNDGTAITIYAIAVHTVTHGDFSALDAVGSFCLDVAGGAAIGLVVAWTLVHARRLVDDPGAELAISLLIPFGAYVPAQEIGWSGVIAAVAAGLYAGARAVDVSAADTRLQLRAFWDLLVFLLNALLFLLIGLQLPNIVDDLEGGVTSTLVAQVLALTATIFAIRMLWMFTVPALVGLFTSRDDPDKPEERRAARLVLGWSAMRGGLSLALALALPLMAMGHAFPDRATIVFLAYGVVLLTLVVPGLTLGPLVRLVGLERGRELRRQLAEARSSMAHAAIARIEELAALDEVDDDSADRLRSVYETRLSRHSATLGDDADARSHAKRARELRHAVIEAQREELDDLRGRREFPAEVLLEVEHELDLDEARIR